MKNRTLLRTSTDVRHRAGRTGFALLKPVAMIGILVALATIFLIPTETMNQINIDDPIKWYLIISSIIGGTTVLALICYLVEKFYESRFGPSKR